MGGRSDYAGGMGADAIMQPTDTLSANGPVPFAGSVMPDRPFRLALACAVALHGLVLFGAYGLRHTSLRELGEPDGQRDAMLVDLVDAGDLPGEQAAAAAPPVPPPVLPASAPPEPLAERVPPVAAEPQPAPAPVAAAAQAPSPEPPAPPEKKTAALAPDKVSPDLLALPDPSRPTGGGTTGAKDKPRQPAVNLSLQWRMPSPSNTPIGRSASVSRPPGVTRSGENDEFGRGVIRALRQTMPNGGGIVGRVTIRLLLSETGNIVEVRIVRNSDDPILDQNVAFAARQSSFPIPPTASTPNDRTFVVTYVYN